MHSNTYASQHQVLLVYVGLAHDRPNNTCSRWLHCMCPADMNKSDVKTSKHKQGYPLQQYSYTVIILRPTIILILLGLTDSMSLLFISSLTRKTLLLIFPKNQVIARPLSLSFPCWLGLFRGTAFMKEELCPWFHNTGIFGLPTSLSVFTMKKH